MPISIRPIIFSLLLATAFFQMTPNFQPTNTFTYLPGVDSQPTTVSVPSIQPGVGTQTTQNPPPPPPSSLTTASSTSSANSPSGSNSNQPSADAINPNPNTLSNLLKNDALTTNPTASPYQNTGYYDYTTANTAFTAISQIGGGCKNQNIISFVAFKQYSTQFYVTSNQYFLSLLQNTSPNQNQLFTAIQNIDCTWSFKTKDGFYISLNTAFSYLTLSPTLSTNQRFYLERKQDWIYIESASSYRYFWTVINGVILINMNSASRFIMEMWPNLNVGWN